jgi:hypothetical protein
MTSESCLSARRRTATPLSRPITSKSSMIESASKGSTYAPRWYRVETMPSRSRVSNASRTGIRLDHAV